MHKRYKIALDVRVTYYSSNNRLITITDIDEISEGITKTGYPCILLKLNNKKKVYITFFDSKRKLEDAFAAILSTQMGQTIHLEYEKYFKKEYSFSKVRSLIKEHRLETYTLDHLLYSNFNIFYKVGYDNKAITNILNKQYPKLQISPIQFEALFNNHVVQEVNTIALAKVLTAICTVPRKFLDAGIWPEHVWKYFLNIHQ